MSAEGVCAGWLDWIRRYVFGPHIGRVPGVWRLTESHTSTGQ